MRVALKGIGKNSQARSESSEHITVVACIGTKDAIVPPLVVYRGKYLQDSWFQSQEDVPQLAITTESGWSNDCVQLKWIQECFDPATKSLAKAGQKPPLLYFDGAEHHVRVKCIEECLKRNIICIVLPAHLSHRYQPLDVTFFNTLKSKYHSQMENHYFGARKAVRVNKGMFWGWHQKAWKATVNSRAIRAGWRDSGLWPLSRQIMCPLPPQRATTPDRPLSPQNVLTPWTQRIYRLNNTAYRQGFIDPDTMITKLSKACGYLLPQVLQQEEEIKKLEATSAQIQAHSASRKRTRFPQGQLFDPKYYSDHAQELQERKHDEQIAKDKRRAKIQKDIVVGPSNSTQD